jgi:hypothetical protein
LENLYRQHHREPRDWKILMYQHHRHQFLHIEHFQQEFLRNFLVVVMLMEYFQIRQFLHHHLHHHQIHLNAHFYLWHCCHRCHHHHHQLMLLRRKLTNCHLHLELILVLMEKYYQQLHRHQQ